MSLGGIVPASGLALGRQLAASGVAPASPTIALWTLRTASTPTGESTASLPGSRTRAAGAGPPSGPPKGPTPTDPREQHIAKIISASRRTDIPRFFARFFAERRREGHVEFRNAFGGRGSASLREEDVGSTASEICGTNDVCRVDPQRSGLQSSREVRHNLTLVGGPVFCSAFPA